MPRWFPSCLLPALAALTACSAASTPVAEVTTVRGGASSTSSTTARTPATTTPATTTPAATPPRATTEPRATASPSRPTPPSGTTVTSGTSQFGEILYDARGQAIYLFDAERTTTAACYDACAAAWPPVLTTGLPRAFGAVLQAKLGVTRRSDGTSQVTYAGHPLYFYAGEGPHEVTCHYVSEFGGLWLVLRPTGAART